MVSKWWSGEKQKMKNFKKSVGKWIAIALGLVAAVMLAYAVYVFVKRNKQNQEAARLEAEAATLESGAPLAGGGVTHVVRRAYKSPLSAGQAGWRMMGGQRIVPTAWDPLAM
jgi:predicted negative regulator of RcsB-dependent stress response